MPDKTIRYKVETTGGGAGSLDAVNGNTLVSKDVTFVFTSDDNRILHYIATTSGTTENPPFNITPDMNSSSWSHQLMYNQNDFSEVVTSTGGTLEPYGRTLLYQVGLGNDLVNVSLRTPRNGAQKTLWIAAGSSVTVKINAESSETFFGALPSANVHQVKHDSDPACAGNLIVPVLDLIASGSSQWLIRNQYSSGLRQFTTEIST